MRLIKIEGNLWELTTLQSSPYDKTIGYENEVNEAILSGRYGCNRGCIRFLSANNVRSLAVAIIELNTNGLPFQEAYTVYHNSKGFYCIVQRQRVFLKDMRGNDENR